MKKLIIVLLVVVLGCSAAFAGDLSLGFSQGLVNTSFVASYDWDHFGVQGDVGFPVFFSTLSAVGAISEKASGESDKDINVLDFILPCVHVGGYWKAVNGKHFGWNLGLGGTAISYFVEGNARVFGLATVTSGLTYKFNDRFSMGLDSSVPLGLLIMPFSEEAAQYTVFGFIQGEGKGADIAMLLIGSVYYLINDAARLSFKWTI